MSEQNKQELEELRVALLKKKAAAAEDFDKQVEHKA